MICRPNRRGGNLPPEEDSNVCARKHYIVLNVQNFGGNNGKDTPVPIPNTAVKLPGADDTWMETSRKNKSLPDYTKTQAVSAWVLFLPCPAWVQSIVSFGITLSVLSFFLLDFTPQ